MSALPSGIFLMKILNLYAGIGGNRKLWEGVDVTAVEIRPEIAAISEDEWRVSGGVEIKTLNEALDLDLPTDEEYQQSKCRNF